MKFIVAVVAVVALQCALAQQIGHQAAEKNPLLRSEQCDSSGCTEQQTSVVLDANWRWVHKVGTYTNCYTGDEWDPSLCPNPVACAQNCAVDGADYVGTYGIHAQDKTLQLDLVTQSNGKNIGSRTYLMDSPNTYKMFMLKNQEFSFDVDVSQLPCGLNGALYFVDMDKDGGQSEYPNDKAGAAYGTGYCDAQCPHDMKFINGEGNILDWTPSPTDPNSGTGKYGTCCSEMDIWEANSRATAYTPHPCTKLGQYRCEGAECGDDATGDRHNGVCDKDGCDLNPFRFGDRSFFGEGSSFAVDTTKPFTVITQFVTNDNTSSGTLVEIRRLFKQNGQVIPTRNVTVGGQSYDSVTDQFCSEQKKETGNPNDFAKRGGLKQMGNAMARGMVLVMSLWDDYSAHMLWLDSNYPPTANPSAPGVTRGPCANTTGVPSDVESQYPNANVKFSNIKIGDFGTTY